MKYIIRNNQLERVWKVIYYNRRFEQVILVEGTEDEVHDYLESEFGFMGRYHALTDDEIQAAKKIGMKIYLAPKFE